MTGSLFEDEPIAPGVGSPTDSWCTPRWIAERLPDVDLDPCSNEMAHVRAGRKLLAGGTDVRWSPFGSSAFVNPPYSKPLPWARRAVELHVDGGESLLLVKLDPTTRWWGVLAEEGECWALRRRLRFDPGPGLDAGCTANFPSAFVLLRTERNHFREFVDGMIRDGHLWGKL